jgi:hypothetical protein
MRKQVEQLAAALADTAAEVQQEVDGLGPVEADRALHFVMAAYDLAVEMWFQKGDPAAPVLTNWERPWRKYGGDNPTTSYLSAPVLPGHRYRLRGNAGGAVYAGVQLYTKGPGYNAPSANISDRNLVDGSGKIDLLIGGTGTDGRPWLPLVTDDYLVMLRLYHHEPTTVSGFSLQRVDDDPLDAVPVARRVERADAYFREEVRSTMAVTETLRAAGVNAYPPTGAPIHRPRYTGALFPTIDNVYDGFFVDLRPGQALRLRGRLPRARFSSFVFYDRWFSTPDFPAHHCYLTDQDIERDGDGSYEIILGPDDPGHPNWVDTAGLLQGIFAIRCLLPQERTLPEVEVIRSP